jgi:hypothetical protein
MPFGMKGSDDKKDMIEYTSKKDLEDNFIHHWKNPEKYAAFKFNDETFPNASGFYALRPYYQKLKICAKETQDYAIEYSWYDKQWKLIRNPFCESIVENLSLGDNTIASLLSGEEFSYVNNVDEDISAFKTFKDVVSKNKRAGEKIKELQQEIKSLRIGNDDLLKTNDKLNNQLIDESKELKTLKTNYQMIEEEKILAFLKRAETVEENENLQQQLKKQKDENNI